MPVGNRNSTTHTATPADFPSNAAEAGRPGTEIRVAAISDAPYSANPLKSHHRRICRARSEKNRVRRRPFPLFRLLSKAPVMCCHSLCRFVNHSIPVIGLLMSCGCYSLNGYVMNSSGQVFYENGNYTLAAAEFHKAVASAPSNLDYAANLARTRWKLGDVAGAEQLYRQILTRSPAHQPSYHGLAELLVAQQRGEEAQAMLTTWAATQPWVPESHLEVAWLQMELGNRDAAAQSLQRALQVNPGHPKALAHLGQYYQQRGQHQQAAAMYQQSLRSQWNQPEVHSRMAQAIAAAGPSHPAAAMAMARGARPPGFTPRMVAAQPLQPSRFAQVGPPPDIMQTALIPFGSAVPSTLPSSAHTAAFPPAIGLGFGLAASTNQIPNAQPENASLTKSIPDPAFGTSVPVAVPATAAALAAPADARANDSLPEIEAF